MKIILIAFYWFLSSFAAAQNLSLAGPRSIKVIEPVSIKISGAELAPGRMLPVELRTPDFLSTTLSAQPFWAAPAIQAVTAAPAAESAQVAEAAPNLAALEAIAAGRTERTPFELHPFARGADRLDLNPQYSGLDNGQLGVLKAISQFVAKNYIDEVPSKDLLDGALHGLLGSLDPYSEFYTPEEFKELQSHLSGNFEGIGVIFNPKAKAGAAVMVNAVIPGSPAEKAGLKAGDELIAINGVAIGPGKIEDVRAAIVGKSGTAVTLTVRRQEAGQSQTLTLNAVRGIVHHPMVYAKTFSGGVGYVHLAQFEDKAVSEVLKKTEEFRAQGIKSLVIDLRSNPGGSVTAVNRMIGAFSKKNTVVMLQKSRGGKGERFVTGEDGPFLDMELKVLVDGHSASASEIFAGAMQDHKRGLVFGSPTYGKGVGQVVLPLNNGAGIKLTTFKWFTPLGRSIQKDKKTGAGGVVPDVAVEVPEELEGKLAQHRMQRLFGQPHEDLQDAVLEAALKP